MRWIRIKVLTVSGLAAALAIALAIGLGNAAAAAAAPACTAGLVPYTMVNHCAYPLWIGVSAGDATQSYPPVNGRQDPAYPPTDGRWQLALGGGSAQICAPRDWGAARIWARTGCSLDTAGHLTCLTGQCGRPGQVDCGAGAAQISGDNPQTLFEITTHADGSAHYDVSVVNGANVPIVATAQGRCTRSTAGCIADLNASCPAALRKTIAPTTATGPIPCGSGTFCPSGHCVAGACVIGCFAPFDACGEANPPAALMCTAPIPGVPDYTDCAGGRGPVTHQQMYGLKNLADGVAMASPHQGTPTCLADADCPAALPRCITSGFDPGIAPPRGAGVCINPDPAQQAVNDYASASVQCASAPVGEACGGYREVGYPDGLGYSCRRLTYSMANGQPHTAHPCVPPTTSGLGACTRSSDPRQPPLYSGVGGVWNPGWMAAAHQAGGSKEPFFRIFNRACPRAYTWPYDDVAALYHCTALEGFTLTFCATVGALQP